MPTKTAMLIARFNPVVKKETEKIFRKLGLSTSEAINLFFNQVRLRKGLPFEVTIPQPNKRKTRGKKDSEKTGGI